MSGARIRPGGPPSSNGLPVVPPGTIVKTMAPRAALLAALWRLAAGCSIEAEPQSPETIDHARGATTAGAVVIPALAQSAQAMAAAPSSPTAPKPGARLFDRRAAPGLIDFAEHVGLDGAIWVGPLPGNGGRDVLIFVPAGADPAASTRIVVHFHGTYSETIAPRTPGAKKRAWVGHKRLTQTMEAIVQLQHDRADNVALVYPMSAGKRAEPGHKGWFNKAYDRMWMASAPEAGCTDNFDTLLDEAVAVLTGSLGVAAQTLRPQVIAEGHSAGGIALRNVAESGTRRVAHYIFLDANFMGWADRCWAAVADPSHDAKVTIVMTDHGIADPFAGRDPWCKAMPVHAAAWPGAEAWCSDGRRAAKALPPGGTVSCQVLREAAEQWPHYTGWCAAFWAGFPDHDRLTLVRTKVSHGDQPRRFSGGLGL